MMAYPKYKLFYFDSQGRAEVIRFIFAQAGVPYVDVRFSKEEWPELKPKMPYGIVPVLEVDGKQLSGTIPIGRYLAEKYGLAGSDDFENAQIAGIIDVIGDMVERNVYALTEKDEARKAELMKELTETHIPRFLSTLETRASANNCVYGWIWGANVTYADLALYIVLQFDKRLIPTVLDSYPALKKLHDSVEALPNIAKWLKERPPQPMN